jgi:hypothetical protein
MQANYVHISGFANQLCDLDPKSLVVFSAVILAECQAILLRILASALCRSGCIVKVHQDLALIDCIIVSWG